MFTVNGKTWNAENRTQNVKLKNGCYECVKSGLAPFDRLRADRSAGENKGFLNKPSPD